MPEGVITQILKRKGIDLCLSLPCIHLKQLILLLQREFKCIDLTREEEGVGIAAGASLAGKKPIMVIQSGGIGNSINALLSLSMLYEFPLPIIISWRGIYKEKIIGQKPMGTRMLGILEGAGIPYVEVMSPGELSKVEEGISRAYSDNTPVAILISPHVFEESESKEEITYPPRSRTLTFEYSGSIPEPEVKRADAIEGIKELLADKLVVSNIGYPSRELYYTEDGPNVFYMLGSFGQASSIGLGLSIFTEKEVLVLEGDGAILTNPNALLSIGAYGPSNLTILALDNGTHGSTGDEKTGAYSLFDLEMLAKACAIKNTDKTAELKKLRSFVNSKSEEGSHFIHFLIKPGNENVGTIPLSPVEIKNRFKKYIQG
jgi:sulfopyruvate decarboxylase subunit beta